MVAKRNLPIYFFTIFFLFIWWFQFRGISHIGICIFWKYGEIYKTDKETGIKVSLCVKHVFVSINEIGLRPRYQPDQT